MGNKNTFYEKNSKFIKKTALVIALGLLFLGLIGFFFNYSYRDKIFPQAFIGGINFGGQTKAQAEAILENRFSATSKNEIDLKYQDKNWIVKTADLNFNLNIVDSVNLAWQIGREGSFKKVLVEQLKSVFGGNHKLAVFSINQDKLNDEILKASNDIYIPEKDASVKLDNPKVTIVPEQIGRKLDFQNTEDSFLMTLGSFKPPSSLNLKVDEIQPKVYSEGAQTAVVQVAQILQNTLTLKSSKKNYTLNSQDFTSWLLFIAVSAELATSGKIDLKKAGSVEEKNTSKWHLIVSIDQDKVQSFLNSISGEINQDAQDAKFQVQNGQVTTFQVSQTGYSLDSIKAKSLITTAIINRKKTAELPVKVIQPEVTSNSATKLGLIELVSEGKTSWRGSPPNRIHNLSLGASKISGTIVKPGEEFSTVKTIGEIGPATGFLPELVIKNSTQVVPDFGGGLCQVSTTLFRAVLNSGLKVTDRTAHSFRVSYYEPPVGMDATIYDPAPDFKFVNTMKTPILIWGIAGDNSLSFQIYGTKDNRQIDISDPVISNYVSSPPPVYTESSTMAPGEIRQVERALQGATASFSYKVTAKNGEVLEKETFVSKYVPLPNSYLMGPGTTVPPPE